MDGAATSTVSVTAPTSRPKAFEGFRIAQLSDIHIGHERFERWPHPGLPKVPLHYTGSSSQLLAEAKNWVGLHSAVEQVRRICARQLATQQPTARKDRFPRSHRSRRPPSM